jgi:hypothetical protein
MTVSIESAERITLLYQAAKRNGSLVSVQELAQLLAERASETEIAEAIATIPSLSSRFELKAGYLTERFRRSPDSEAEAQSRNLARRNMRYAAEFVSLLHSNPFKMVAVSGSTSYGSASRSKDVDFFCIAPSGRMWLSVTMGLLMARAFSLFHRQAPTVCLSCIMDEDFAHSAFATEGNSLFARDAIETKVVTGLALYSSLLSRASWISKFYPFAYDAAMGADHIEPRVTRPSAIDRVLNKLLFLSVGRYMHLKSALLNRKLRAAGRLGDVFSIRCGEDHLIYESKRYASLREEYEVVLPARTVIQN